MNFILFIVNIIITPHNEFIIFIVNIIVTPPPAAHQR